MKQQLLRDEDGVARYRHEVLVAVLRVDPERSLLQVLVRRRSRDPFAGRWALPGGALEATETMEASLGRHLAHHCGVRALAHVEQVETFSQPDRDPVQRTVATLYLGLLPFDEDTVLPSDAAWVDVDALPDMAFDHRHQVVVARDRLVGKLSYTNIGFALAPAEFTLPMLRTIYQTVLGHSVDETNLGRVLRRRGQLERVGRSDRSGARGGRPPTTWRFTTSSYVVTDPFAVLGPGRS